MELELELPLCHLLRRSGLPCTRTPLCMRLPSAGARAAPGGCLRDGHRAAVQNAAGSGLGRSGDRVPGDGQEVAAKNGDQGAFILHGQRAEIIPWPACASPLRAPARSSLWQVLDQKELEDDDLFDALRMEIMILKQLKHPCVPRHIYDERPVLAPPPQSAP